jgi:hypothetical protein
MSKEVTKEICDARTEMIMFKLNEQDKKLETQAEQAKKTTATLTGNGNGEVGMKGRLHGVSVKVDWLQKLIIILLGVLTTLAVASVKSVFFS